MKKELREKIMNARLEQDEGEFLLKSKAIIDQIKGMEAFRQANTIMMYLDFRKEVKTEELVRCCLQEGKEVAVPVTVVRERQLIPSVIKHYPDDITSGTWGIPEPKADCLRPVEPELIDLVIVPGVAYDVACNRLGYGGGFYDRFLRRTRQDAIFIAPAFELQILENVYPEAHDYPVHYIITEKRIISRK